MTVPEGMKAMEKRPTIALDFDGCIHEYEDGWRDGSIYSTCDLAGIHLAHERGYAVVILTSRDPIQVADYLAAADLKVATDLGGSIAFWDGGDDGKRVLVTKWKVAATAYVDDRAIRHTFGDDWKVTLDLADGLK